MSCQFDLTLYVFLSILHYSWLTFQSFLAIVLNLCISAPQPCSVSRAVYRMLKASNTNVPAEPTVLRMVAELNAKRVSTELQDGCLG